MRRETSIFVLLSVMCIACAISAIAQTTPFVINGYIFNPDGSSCNGQDVQITDLATGANWTVAVPLTSNYYSLVLDSSSVSTGDILQFNISNSSHSQTTEYTIMDSDIKHGGMTKDITFVSNETTVPVSDFQFNISGYIFNPDGSPCIEPEIRITDLDLNISWNATVDSASNYYSLMLGNNTVSTGDILQFNILCSSQSQTDEYTITDSEIENGGITKNITFTSSGTTVPVLDFPFNISGYIFNSDGSPCNGPDVHITNLNTSVNRTALVQPTSNYYHLVLNNSSVSTCNILHFNISCSSQSQTAEHMITGSEIENGGITRDITFASNETTVLVQDFPFMINGGIYYINEQENFNPHISITNLNTTISWNATTCSGYNYFNLLLCTGDVSIGDVLEFNVTNNGKIFKLLYHTITQDDINRNGLFDIISPGSLRSDVTIESIEMPDWVCPGSLNRIYVTVRNTGIVNAGLFILSMTVDGIPIDNVTISSLKHRESAVAQFTWEPTDAGNYTLCARADLENLLNESNRENNNLIEKVKVDPVSVINVPHDYPGIQDAVNNSTAYTVIYVDEGDYESKLNITDRDHLKILGSGEDTRIIVHGSPAWLKPNLIEIVNSSNIELNGFAARIDSSGCGSQFPSGWRAINIQESKNISLTNLQLTHASWTDSSFLIRIEGSTDCLIADNFISGSKSPASFGKRLATSGVLITSDNNTICNNTIINCQYTIKLQGDNNTIYANNLFFTEAGDSQVNTLAIDIGQDNHWNVTVPVSYIHNNTTFTNYIGNYWDGWIDEDLDDDGIWDAPYSIGTLTDLYPLIEPHELTFDLIASEIARPSRIYTGRNNTVLATIERKGTYPVPEPLKITLTANDVAIAAKIITMGREQKTTLRFSWVPESAGSYNLEIDVQPDTDILEVDTINNILFTNVEVLSPEFNYTGEIGSALDFLNESQTPIGSICGVSNSAWAALSVTACGEDPAAGRWKPHQQSLIGYLQNDPENSIIGMPPWTNPDGLDNVDDFAWMILVISAIGEDPTDYGGVNYLVMLESYYDGNQFHDPNLVEEDALAILALTACGADNSEMASRAVNYIKDKQNDNGGWSSHSDDSDIKVTSLVIQALVAAGDDDKEVIDKALNYYKNMQEDDGGFSDVITTSYVIMAITAAGENPEDLIRNNNNPIDYLLDLQQDDGLFNYTTNLSLFPDKTTIFPIQALAGVPHPVMIKTLREEPPFPDILLGTYKIDIENEVYVNTTYTVSTKIRSNGGIFDVMLSSGGKPVNNQSVKSVWSDSTTPVTFSWKPNSTGIHDLSIEADTGNRINERYENNNQITRQVNVVLPDLYPDAIGAIILPPEVYVNATSNVTVLIRGRTDESFNVTLKADGGILNEWMIEEINDFVELSSDWRPVYKREYSLELIVDDSDKVMERIETNNNIARKVNVIYPDLVPTAITPYPVYVNATNLIIVSIKGTAECFDVSLIENGTEVGRTSNITCYGNLNVTIPWKPARLGNCTLQASIDPGNNITETDETNNNITLGFEVVLPDIVPVRITPDLIFLNETNRVIITINGTTEGFNATLLANGTCIGTGVDLDTYNGTIEFEWTPARSGKYNLTVMLDPDNAIDETNETNNNLSIIITAANRIDLELLFPLGGEILSGMQDITWNATYEEPISIDLLYSVNNGYDWNFIEENTTNIGCYEWNTKDVLDGKYMIKVIARWGDVIQEDWSGRLYIYNKKSATEWSGFHGNAGFSQSDGPDTNEMAWASDDIGAEPSSSLIVADGMVFVYCVGWEKMYSDYTYLVALNESDGEVLWGTRIGLRVKGSWATPAHDQNGKIYVSSGNSLFCIDTTKKNKGPILWSFIFPDGGVSVNGGPLVDRGKVYVGSWGGGHYYCLDAKSGAEIWNFTINGCAQSTPAAANGRVFFGDWSGDVEPKAYAVDMDDGYEIWNTSLDGDVCGSLTISDGIVYFSTTKGIFYALDEGNGTQVWTRNIKYTDSTPAVWRIPNSESYVYVADGYLSENIYCFNAKNGESVWTRIKIGSWTNSPRGTKDGKIFVGKTGGKDMMPGYTKLYCLNALTGDEIWHTDSGGGTVAIANAKVYTTGGTRVYAFGSNTMPDLTVEKIYVPDNVNIEETVVITAQINNIGKSNVSESFSVELTHKNELVDKITVSSLDVGNVTNVSFNWTPKQTGPHRLVAEVDPDETVAESGDPTNNLCGANVTVGDYQPDLAVTAIDAPYVNRVGRGINITVHIEKTGSETNSSFNVSLRVNSRVKNTTTTSLLNNDGTDNDNNNGINNTTAVGFNWTPDKIGTYSLTGTVDLDGDVDKTNNNMTKEIEVVTNKTFFGYGSGYNGGTGGGSSGGVGSGDGTGDSGEAGADGVEYSDDTSTLRERMSDITGFLFGDDSPGSSGGGGALSLALIICLIVILGLLYHGRRSEKRMLNDEKYHSRIPSGFRRKKS